MKCAQYTEQYGRALETNTHLTSLSLSTLGINDSNLYHIADALRVNNTLTFLDLSGNKFGTEGLIAISDALRNNTALIELNVIGQSKDFGESALTHVMEMLDNNITLKKIVWRLHSRQSFRINNQITRNNEIERRLLSGLSVDDILPESRRGQPLPTPKGHGGTHTTTQTTQTTTPKTTTQTTQTTNQTQTQTTNQTQTQSQTPPPKTTTTTTTQTPTQTTQTTQPTQTTQTTQTTPKEKPSGLRYDEGRLIWWVENVSDGAQISVEITEPKQKVFISNIDHSFVIITGKCTKISVERAKDSGIIFDDVISIVEVVNSEKIQLQANGVIPAIQLDGTHGVSMYIQSDIGLDVEIVTSLCSGLNIITPGEREEDDNKETPLPEQFETNYDKEKKKWRSLPSQHSGV